MKVKKKTAVVLGGGGFIGGHLAKRLLNEGFYVTVVDIKPKHEFFDVNEICDIYVSGDLRDPRLVENIISEGVDEVYQLAADMGGAGYIFTGNNDANVMHNSALINLNVAHECAKKNVKRVFYSSSACMYPEHNQLDPDNPNCEESSAYPANPDSEYGWEKLFSERMFFAFNRNYNLDVRVARFHNIFGPQGTWEGGKEKAPAAMCRKAAEATMPGFMPKIEVWGDGQQTRSFLYIDDCVEAILRFMIQEEFMGHVSIGSAQMAIDISKGVETKIHNIEGQAFEDKYGFPCPVGVRGRNSHNKLYKEKIGWEVSMPLIEGMEKTYEWIEAQVKNKIYSHD